MKSAGLSRRSAIGLAAIAVGAAGVGGWLRRGMPLGDDVSAVMDVAALAGAAGFPSEEPMQARLTMLVFSDYACGVCRKVEPWWREAVRAAGDVRIVHRDWPILGEQSVRAARIALAADRQRRYREVHDELMRRRGLGEPALRAAVLAAGADWTLLTRDLKAHTGAIDAKLAQTARDALQLGLRGAPGFLIGPIRIEGGASQRQFVNAIERARESAAA